jgi:hypothetical protein
VQNVAWTQSIAVDWSNYSEIDKGKVYKYAVRIGEKDS